jgi:signal transduction histidine kinase
MAKPPRNRKKAAMKTDVEQLAELYVQARTALVRAGRTLHDHVGSSLSAAGVQLQLLHMDLPVAAARIDEIIGTLDEALNRLRELSHELCPSPAYRGGLKQALLRLAEQNWSKHCDVAVAYAATAVLPAEIAVALYESAAAAVEQAIRKGAVRVSIAVRGTRSLALRITDDGRPSGRARALSAIRTLARAQGLAFECTTGKSTIVCIQYAVRRTPGG